MSEIQSILEFNRNLQNKTIEYAREESWTPVDGALLLSGIQPSSRFDNEFEAYQWGIEFPFRADEILLRTAYAERTSPLRALEGGYLPSKPSRLHDAILILKRWDDHCYGLLEDGNKPPSTLTPHAFVQWWLEIDEKLEDTRFQQAIVDVLVHRVPPKAGDDTVYEFPIDTVPLGRGKSSYIAGSLASHMQNRPALIVPKKNQNLSVPIGEICLSVYRDRGDPYNLGTISRILLERVSDGKIQDVAFLSEIKADKSDDCGFRYLQSGKEKSQTWGALRKLLEIIKKKNSS